MGIADIVFCGMLAIALPIAFYFIFYEVLIPMFNSVFKKEITVNNRDRNDLYWYAVFVSLCFLIYIQVSYSNQQERCAEEKSQLYEETYNEAYVDGAEDASNFLKYEFENHDRPQCPTDDIMADSITREDFKYALQAVEGSMEEYYAQLDDMFSYSGRGLGEALLEVSEELN